MLQHMGADDRVKRFVGERKPLDVRLVEADSLGALSGFGIDDEIDALQIHFSPDCTQYMQPLSCASPHIQSRCTHTVASDSHSSRPEVMRHALPRRKAYHSIGTKWQH